MLPGLKIYAAVGFGSALGAVARHLCAILIGVEPGTFPWSTFAVNCAGAFLIGVIAVLTADGGRWPISPVLRAFAVAGFCGGFTTFSIFSLEALHLLEFGRADLAGLYVGASLVAWMASVWIGVRSAGLVAAKNGRG